MSSKNQTLFRRLVFCFGLKKILLPTDRQQTKKIILLFG